MRDRPRARLFVLQVLVVSLLATLLGRLWFLQVHSADAYAEAASTNRVRQVVTTAPRGGVYDVRGRPLVRNRTALVVTVDRARLRREPDHGASVLARLGKVLGKPATLLRSETTPCGGTVKPPCWRGSPYQPVPVQEYASDDAAGLRRVLAVEEHREDFPGVATQYAAVRDYPQGTRAAHVLGYLGPISPEETALPQYDGVQDSALVGRSGVEASYDAALRGADGVQQLLVDHVGTVTGVQSDTPARPGDSLVLSLDAGVQQAAEQALEHAVQRARTLPARGGGGTYKADSGSVVVMEAKTGRVVAMASYPSYDPSVFVGGASDEEYAQLVDESRGAPLVFRAIQGAYAPASTFKPVSTSAVLGDGYARDGIYPCPGAYAPLGGKRNFEGESFGPITLRTALVKSCDTVFYDFAYEQWLRDGGNDPVARPKDPMVRMAQAFGLGTRTGVDLPAERSGTIADRAFLQERWERLRGEYCKGADNPDLDAERRRADREFCDDGNRFRAGDAANFAIGQGDTLVTPLQLATVYAAIANGGTVLEPHVARALLSADGSTVREVRPKVRGHVPVSKDDLAFLREALHGVTTEGTARGSFGGFPVAVAGKTGTGEVAGKQDTAWFASFAPVQDPQLVVVGMVSQGGTGATTAAPMVREVYDALYGVGRPSVLPGGRLPSGLPVVRADGTVGPPGSRGARRPATVPYVVPPTAALAKGKGGRPATAAGR
ncbi:MAG: penicillin-binding protein 2 [Frankiales bacterium]|nr:penicillin-binding protein 2 [Frankiales bacterium]